MLTLRSPAKVNLFLRVLRRRADGYHEIASLFQAIDLSDRIHFSLAEKDHLSSTDPKLPLDKNNLIWKAADLFRQKTHQKFSLNVQLEKNIPTEAGLGGGSSNAATTLWALNRLLETKIPVETLMQWAGEIGSDVAFFFSGGTAYCTGRGEIVRPLPPLPPQTLTIAKPPYGLSTPAVYKSLDLTLLSQRHPEEALNHFYSGQPHYFNDLEAAALKIKPELAAFKKSVLDQGYPIVMLSGSGSSFFCIGSGLPYSFINSSQANWY